MADRTHMDAWFIHPKLAMNLLDSDTARRVQSRLPDASYPMWRYHHMDLMERALAEAFGALQPASVIVALAEGSLEVGRLVWIEQRFYYRGVDKALDEVAAGRVGRAEFHAPLATDPAVKVSGSYNVEHLTSSTSAGMLSGAGRQFILGYVQGLDGDTVALRPVLIADRWGPGVHRPGIGFIEEEPSRVWPRNVDQFDGVDWEMRLRPGDLKMLKGVTEAQTKAWLAEILGEPEIPKDWGGEQYDLWTDRITVNGKRVQAAIALKGPARFHPMTVADLGKNGDQVSRLAHTAADLLVVQHCHTITAQVIHLLHAYAATPGNLRRYLAIDGYDTIRILRHFKYLT